MWLAIKRVALNFVWLIKFPYFLLALTKTHGSKHTTHKILLAISLCACVICFSSHICDSVATLTLLFLVSVCLFIHCCCCCSVFFFCCFILFYFILILFFLSILNYIIKRWFKLIHTQTKRGTTHWNRLYDILRVEVLRQQKRESNRMTIIQRKKENERICERENQIWKATEIKN